jgi:hypothetical protein
MTAAESAVAVVPTSPSFLAEYPGLELHVVARYREDRRPSLLRVFVETAPPRPIACDKREREHEKPRAGSGSPAWRWGQTAVFFACRAVVGRSINKTARRYSAVGKQGSERELGLHLFS